MSSKLHSIAALYNEVTKLHYQLYRYCQTHEYKPKQQDFEDIVIIHRTIKDIDNLAGQLIESWKEKNFINENKT